MVNVFARNAEGPDSIPHMGKLCDSPFLVFPDEGAGILLEISQLNTHSLS